LGPGLDRPERSQPPIRGVSISAMFRGLFMAGLTASEAGNITAWLHGLPTTRDGWTIREIANLEFLSHLVEDGILES
jgi:hypothetical protein